MISVMKALGDENRLRIVHLLMQRAMCVCELEIILALSQSNTSRHLANLRNGRIVEPVKHGQWTFYRFSDAFFKNHRILLDYLRDQFEGCVPYDEDLARLNRYQQAGFSCQAICKDVCAVQDVLASRINPSCQEE